MDSLLARLSWQRPVSLETVVEDQPRLLSYDGDKFKEEDLSSTGV